MYRVAQLHAGTPRCVSRIETQLTQGQNAARSVSNRRPATDRRWSDKVIAPRAALLIAVGGARG
jgi:hypothetical protein